MQICDEALIELISPLNSALPSPVDNMIAKSKSQLYHLCYEVTDIHVAVAELDAGGWRLMDEIKPAPAICSVYPRFRISTVIPTKILSE
jgi:hypothetical protein